MDLSTIAMDKAQARKLFLEYRNAIRQLHSEEDAEIMRGYRALAQGQQLLHLSETIKAGGHMVASRNEIVPRLAVAPASAEFVYVSTRNNGSCKFHVEQRPHWKRKKGIVHCPADTLPRCGWEQTTAGGQRAMVPPVPPRFRPRHALSNYHVLFEAEWQKCAPVDPALLKHIGGDLYAVLAVWDLTELERSVLMRRFA
jgi:hypothetical protein